MISQLVWTGVAITMIITFGIVIGYAMGRYSAFEEIRKWIDKNKEAK